MAYLSPPFFVRRIFNPLAMRFGIGGSTALAVKGRRSGKMLRVPVIPVEHEGARYIVSTRGEADWVKNLRAAGELRLCDETLTAQEVPVAETPPIIAAYRKVAGRTVKAYWETLPDPADHPTFRLTPRG